MEINDREKSGNLMQKDFNYTQSLLTLTTKVRLVKAMAFPVVMYGCES